MGLQLVALEGTSSRQSSAVSEPAPCLPARGIPSVVKVGVVQRTVTVSPTRSAEKSRTGAGRCSEGGRSGPSLAHPVIRISAMQILLEARRTTATMERSAVF